MLAACVKRGLTEELLERERRDDKLTGDDIETGRSCTGERDEMRRERDEFSFESGSSR